MPKYHTHIPIGIIVCCVIGAILMQWGCQTSATWVELFMWGIFGSIFPDIDTKSKVQRLSYYLLLVIMCCLLLGKKYAPAAFVGGIALVPHLVHHRGLFHRGWFLVSCTLLSVIIGCSVFPHFRTKIMMSGLFFLGGALSHVVLDGGWGMLLRR